MKLFMGFMFVSILNPGYGTMMMTLVYDLLYTKVRVL